MLEETCQKILDSGCLVFAFCGLDRRWRGGWVEYGEGGGGDGGERVSEGRGEGGGEGAGEPWVASWWGGLR